MNKRMHIAHFTNTYHPVVSGVVRSIDTFRQSLTELGHLVFIFAQDAGDYEDTEPFIFRYPALDIPAMHDFPLTIPFSPFIEKLLPSLKPDIIHSHHPFLLGHSAAWRADELNLPLVFTFHTRYRDYSHYVPMTQNLVKQQIDQFISDYMRRCQHIVVPSESMQALLASEYGVTERVSIVPTGIDLTLYQKVNRQAMRQKYGLGRGKVLISVGRLAKEKNWQTLLAAVRQVVQQHDDIRLVLIGEGEERKNLEQYTRELGLANHVKFVGRVPFKDVVGYLRAADLFCFASVTETQGLVTMEALAAGLPVVAVDGTGTRDGVEHGQEGLLTPNSSEALGQAIEQVISDEDMLQRFRVATTQKAQTFDATIQARKLIAVYEQAKIDKQAGISIQVEGHKPMVEFVKDSWHRLTGT